MSQISTIPLHSPIGLPFDLELAVQGAQLVTAGGLAARLVAVDDTVPESFRLKVQLEGQSYPRSFCSDGRYHGDGRVTDWDLYLAPVAANDAPSHAARARQEAAAA